MINNLQIFTIFVWLCIYCFCLLSSKYLAAFNTRQNIDEFNDLNGMSKQFARIDCFQVSVSWSLKYTFLELVQLYSTNRLCACCWEIASVTRWHQLFTQLKIYLFQNFFNTRPRHTTSNNVNYLQMLQHVLNSNIFILLNPIGTRFFERNIQMKTWTELSALF